MSLQLGGPEEEAWLLLTLDWAQAENAIMYHIPSNLGTTHSIAEHGTSIRN